MGAKKKQPKAAPLSRPPLERMLRIHQAIQAGRHPNATQLAQKLEVSTKSIHRDIEFMRDRLELPIEYDSSKFGYYYYEEVNSFPSFEITEGELFALLVAEKALQQYRGTNFEKPLLSAFRKMTSSLPDTITFHLQDWEQTISFRTSAEPILDLETFEVLSKALSKKVQLELEYRKPGRKSTEKRIVDPYHLANINGEWFLFAFCHLRNDVRTFAPSRILKATPTGETFQRPRKFSLEKRLRDSFGVHSGEGEFDVLIRFSDHVADYIREKRWHQSQKLRELADGGIELRMRLSSLEEVKRWILGWGGQAVALQPVELVDAIRNSVEALQKSLST